MATGIGSESARQRLPELLDRAHAGEQAIIKNHGLSYAALVPLDQRVDFQRVGLLALRGSRVGLWVLAGLLNGNNEIFRPNGAFAPFGTFRAVGFC
ncbi:hypothetical protein CCR95_08510 [Thiocystis minor]|nr:hypothetical protein [Thiocystis minor]